MNQAQTASDTKMQYEYASNLSVLALFIFGEVEMS